MTRRDGQGEEGICGQAAMRSFEKAQKWVGHRSELPTITNSSPKTCYCGQNCPKDIITTYKRDYQEWKFSPKCQPYKHLDNFKVFQGVSLLNEDDNERQPMESRTSYKSMFLPHQVEPVKKQENPAVRTSIIVGEPCCGHYTSDFKPWTSPSSGTIKYLNGFLSTTHADYIQHALQRTKPVLKARQSSEGSKAPFESTTTMKEDFIKWDLPRRSATSIKGGKKDWKKGYDQIPLSKCASDGNHCARCHDNYKNKRIDSGMMCNMDKDRHRTVSCMVSTYTKQ